MEPLLQEGDVILKRRDGEPLRLSLSHKGTAEQEALAAAARLVSTALDSEGRKALAANANKQLPWTRFLPAEELRTFLDEFVECFEACADLGDFTALGRLLTEWKNTASLHAEGVAPRLKTPIPKVGGKVRRPGR